VAAVGAVDVNGLKIFDGPCKKLKNLNFSGHFESVFMFSAFKFLLAA